MDASRSAMRALLARKRGMAWEGFSQVFVRGRIAQRDACPPRSEENKCGIFFFARSSGT
ncbi:hypothetical protein HYV74_03190 [Candidatus Uhrbacteria bacterium]|nr:hypothetical protein [Candidatus Uhrbacteria bacterium]